MKAINDFLARVGFDPSDAPRYLVLLRRGAFIGVILYWCLSSDPRYNLHLNLISFLAAIVWCYLDGAFDRGRWLSAIVEGITLHLIAVATSNLLILALGNPLETPR